MQICPSMPLPTMDALAGNINKLSPFYKYFQIDIGDGSYVNNRTVQVGDIMRNYKQFKNYQSLIFDFHLMVSDFGGDIAQLNQLQELITIKNIFIHYSAIKDFTANVFELSTIPIGLALNPKDRVDDLISHYDLEIIPSIQIMSVVPGVQGNPFLLETLDKIQQLRQMGYKKKIFLDGAVNDKTLPMIDGRKFKPDIICPGSYLTKPDDPEILKERVKFLSSYV